MKPLLHVRPSKLEISFPTRKALLKTGPPNLCILVGYLKQILLFYTNILGYAQAWTLYNEPLVYNCDG